MELRLARDDEGAPEIFRSIQGEGPMAGRARTFIRLSGCNLHCAWCDTAYTWNWIGSPFAHERAEKFDPKHEMVKLPVEQAADLIRALPSDGVVITGGEPLMQQEALVRLIDVLGDALIEIETNGSIAPSQELTARIDLFVVSPKLAHSGNDAAIALKDDVLRAFAALESAVFKFVARTPADLDEVAALATRYAIMPKHIQVMPEGMTPETLDARLPTLAAAASARGYALSDRLHIRQFGARRGI